MAKILVADDNSNIQKMVGLALKDQGIEVIAVGNGEAAVRKAVDLKPDLILADVFMPVRNGYEVCKFVKDDSALSHIPVILLVGAFDPLDEQEAQRVGADGVLKKPFVPPDPLISMVKSALTRAGVVLGGTNTPPLPPPVPAVAKPAVVSAPRVVPPPPPAFAPEEEPIAPSSFSLRPATLTIEKVAEPLAFGSLLHTASTEEETVFTVSPSALTAPERDWGSPAAADELEGEEEAKNSASWRLSSVEDAVDEVPAGQKDWREAAFTGIGLEKPSGVEWAPSIEKNNLSITEEDAAALAKKYEDVSQTLPTRRPEDWAKAIGEVFPEAPPAPFEAPIPTINATVAGPPASVSESAPVGEPAGSVPAQVSETAGVAAEPATTMPNADVNSWMAGAISPWEAEIQRAAQLAATWDSLKATPAVVADETSEPEAFLHSGLMSGSNDPVAEAAEPEPAAAEELPTETPVVQSAYSAEPQLSPPTEAILQQESAHAVAPELPAIHDSLAAVTHVAIEPAPVPGPNMDEIVAKVLAKMNPDVLQAVTREILKPLVEAMIEDELNKK